MLIIKGDTVLDVTPKAYEVIYKEHDFAIKEEPEEETAAVADEPKAPTKKAKAKAGEE